MLTIGLVGCGNWGKLILRDLVSLGCSVWTTARSPATIANAAAGGATGQVRTVAELPACDGYVVASPLSAHAANVLELLPRGRPIYVEKPLTDDLVRAEEILRQADGRVFVMDKWRYHRGVLALADLVRKAPYGPLQVIRTRRVGWGHPHLQTDAVWTLFPHDLSIVLHLLGLLPPPQSAVLECESDGVPTGIHAFARHAQVQIAMEVSAASVVWERSVRVSFALATVVMPSSMSDHLLIQEGQGSDREPRSPPIRLPIAVNMPLSDELRAFCDHLRGAPPPLSSIADGVSVVRTIAAFRRLAGMG